MRKQSVLEITWRQDICFLCAVRFRLLSPFPNDSSSVPERQLRRATSSSNATSIARHASQNEDPSSAQSLLPKHTHMGGVFRRVPSWTKPTFRANPTLTDEELKQRETLLSQNPALGSVWVQRQGAKSSDECVSRTAQNVKLTSQSPTEQDQNMSGDYSQPSRITWGRSPSYRANRNCPKCQHFCFGKHRRCPSCGATQPDSSISHSGFEWRSTYPHRIAELTECSSGNERNDGDISYNVRDHRPDASKPGLPTDLGEELSKFENSKRSTPASDPEARFQKFMSENGRFSGFRELHPALVPSTCRPLNPEGQTPESQGRNFEQSQSSQSIPTLETTEIKEDTGTSAQLEPRPARRKRARWRQSRQSDGEIDLETPEVSIHPASKKRSEVLDFDDIDNDFFDDEFDASGRRSRKGNKNDNRMDAEEAYHDDPAPIYLPDFISVANLADVLGMRPSFFLERMKELGFENASHNHILDSETAGLVASEFGYDPIFEKTTDDLVAAPPPGDISNFPLRPPVVTIMGHVDHGKTTILDWLRKSSVAASEHGGITQHIGAFSVLMPSGKLITFLDTPGHAAFLDMRRRGADVTDIVILVVAADDSVKPQTIEAIKHAKDANVPMIVAINKIDKENVNVERVKQDLARHNINIEDFGGDIQAVCVSGKTGQGMLELEEAVITLSELLDHRADRNGNVEGWVIEATTKKAGRVATVLVKRGTIRPGDVVVAGTTWARIRTLKNEAGTHVKEALPGTPVEVDGWKEQPVAGSEVLQAPNEQVAKDVVNWRLEKAEAKRMSDDIYAINEARQMVSEKRKLEDVNQNDVSAEDTSIFKGSQSGPVGVPFLIKADVSGSVEAIINSVSALGNNEIFAQILRSGVGSIGEFDIQYAAAAKAHIISFNMPIDTATSLLAKTEGVKILDHRIIYELIDNVKSELSEQLAPLITKRVSGEAEIKEIFEIALKRREKTVVAGCKVRNGVINRSHKVRVLRRDKIIYDGTLSSLKNLKKDVTEMRKGTECGMAFDNWTNFVIGDHVQTYEEISEKRFL